MTRANDGWGWGILFCSKQISYTHNVLTGERWWMIQGATINNEL